MPDKELIEKTLNGDQSAFALLLSRYENLIQGLGYKLLGNLHDAQDLTQEVFFNSYKNLPRLKDKTKFRSWIYTIALNLGKNWFKKRGLLHKKIKMSSLKEEDITLDFKKTSPGLLTLYTIPKETYVAFYDWPEKTITNFAYQKLAGKEKINGENYWKVECWEVEDVFKDESNKSCYDSEWYYNQKEDYFSYIAKNFHQRGEKGKIITSKDKEWDEPRDIKFPVKIKSSGKIKWLENNKYSGPTAPIGIETAGLWKLELGKKDFKCIRVFQMFWPENRILYETFLDISGRTILGRRYNGPGWKHQGSNIDSLKRKDCPFLEYNNVKFYLYYDVIPDQSI
ncbi:hypothetical protein KAW08_03265 [bacterium]|nr:hypothetical protein [bacterium]